jgi:hypothetical protein
MVSTTGYTVTPEILAGFRQLLDHITKMQRTSCDERNAIWKAYKKA